MLLICVKWCSSSRRFGAVMLLMFTWATFKSWPGFWRELWEEATRPRGLRERGAAAVEGAETVG